MRKLPFIAVAWVAPLAVAATAAVAGGGAVSLADAPPATAAAVPRAAADTASFLGALGVPVSTGAAPGYVPDAVCADCHAAIARSFRSVGMARSFYRPSRAAAVERFGEPFFHGPSQRWYELDWRAETLVFRRWQLDAAGRRVHELEQPVDWVLGSGNRARTYLFRTPAGELWQLPVAWYSQEGAWGMAPGYDRADHDEVLRLVQRECMVCHDAYPQLAAGDDRYGMPHRFPAEMPQGIGCQRCHGPGAEHVRRLKDPAFLPEDAIAAIFDPGRLPPERRADVCMQCHLQPAVVLPAVRRFARGDLAYRAGEPLAAHRVEMVPDLEPAKKNERSAERFEINHHPFRLEQSRCFRESAGALTCLTCHDPHDKPGPAERIAHVRRACLQCHAAEQCPSATKAPAHAGVASGAPARPAVAGDCAGCHMPQRRTDDVVHAVMTDHLIQRGPAGPELVAPRPERDPVVVGVRFLRPAEAPPGAEGELYRAIAALRLGARAAALPHVERLLAAAPVAEPEPWLRLGEGQLGQRRYAEAEAGLRRLLALVPEVPLLRNMLALAAAGQGRGDEALAHLREALALDPELVEARYNLGRLLLAWGRAAEAAPELERALALRPNLPQGWLRLGEAREALGERAAAIGHYRRAIAVEPGLTAAHVALGRALLTAGDRDGAAAAFALGERYAREPGTVAAAARAAAKGGSAGAR